MKTKIKQETHPPTPPTLLSPLKDHTLCIQQHLHALSCVFAETDCVCFGHLGSLILSLSHFCISAWLMEEDTKLTGPSLWGRGLLWARLRARSSFCLLGIALTFPSCPSSSSSSSSSWQEGEFRKGLSLRVMMSATASFSLSNHRASTAASHGTHQSGAQHIKPQVTATGKETKSEKNV